MEVYDGRETMRSVADAIAELGDSAESGAEISALPVLLPDGGIIAPCVLVKAPTRDPTRAVRLPGVVVMQRVHLDDPL